MFRAGTLVKWTKCENSLCSLCGDEILDAVAWWRKELLVVRGPLRDTHFGTLYELEEFLLPIAPLPQARIWHEGEPPTIATLEFNADDIFTTARIAHVHGCHMKKV